ncbi:MAG: TonB-dependent receptor [Pseudomonadota bacterium]
MLRSSVPIFLISTLSLSMMHGAVAADKSVQIDPVVVTANPFGKTANNFVQPITIVTGDEIVKNPGSTIGDVLGREPGIRSSYYGPNVSRPVIRGLDGDQINILQNGISNLDASQTSADHNVAIDPLAIEKIEVLRGPSALLYGPKSVGGIVNIIDNRIPSERIDAPVTGIVDGRFNSTNSERSGSFLIEGGVDDFAWHINGFKRRAETTRIPGFSRSSQLRLAEPLEAGEEEDRNRIDNSQSETEGVTVGFSKFFDKGYFGLSYSRYDSEYGIVGHEHAHEDDDDDHEEEEHGDTLLEMEQNRFDLAGLYKSPFKYIKEIKYKAGYSDYEHQEFEGDEAGTTFKNEGFDSRVEFVHDKINNIDGVFGVQIGMNDFEALGSEAFVPTTTTLNLSAFILEEIDLGDVDLQFGGRLDFQDIEKDASATFGASDTRDDFTGSASIAAIYNLPQDYKVALSTTYTQRAPNAQELFANGVHLATQTFEVGDENLDVQKSIGVDLSLRKTSGRFTGEFNVFYTHFEDFITLTPTGTNDAESEVPIFNYVNLPAEIYGVELKTGVNAFNNGTHIVDFELRGDYLKGRNRDTDQDLPRIAPARVGGSAIYQYQDVTLRFDTDYNFSQDETAPEELSTDSFTMVDFGIDYDLELDNVSTTLYIQGTNLLDEEARNHVSFLKDRAPMPGRSVMVGLRSSF